MKNNRNSIDGFVPRRTGSQIGELHSNKRPSQRAKSVDRSLHTGSAVRETFGQARVGQSIGRSDIDDSLREIDSSTPEQELSKRQRRARNKQSSHKGRRIAKRLAIGVLIIAVLIGGYVGVKFFLASNNIFQGSFFDLAQSQPLKMDANGRSNFVVFGTAEDSEGGQHGGANLTDSIMVVSIDQNAKNAYLMSLPRDLWVDYDESCSVGNQGRINAVYYCASDDGVDEEVGAAALQSKVGEITGLDIQYNVHLNFTAVVEAVDAVGGVEVVIESEDPRGIFDDNFDWKCNYKCNFVKYPNGPTGLMDGEHALALARARGASGNTYGLPNANFDREKNQQKIIKALREKAVSAGTLTNIGAVTGLIDALGDNLRTNIETKEIRTMMTLGTDIQTGSIRSLSLVEPDNTLVETGNIGSQSIVQPVLGLYDYRDIQDYVKKNVSTDQVVKEAAEIVVLNGSEQPGVAQTKADELIEAGYNVTIVDNAPEGTYGRIEIYQIGDENTATASKLAARYSVALKTTLPPIAVSDTTDFVIIIGSAQ